MTTVGLVLWLAAGWAVTSWYDRKGMDRLQPEVLAFLQRSAQAFATGGGREPDSLRRG